MPKAAVYQADKQAKEDLQVNLGGPQTASIIRTQPKAVRLVPVTEKPGSSKITKLVLFTVLVVATTYSLIHFPEYTFVTIGCDFVFLIWWMFTETAKGWFLMIGALVAFYFGLPLVIQRAHLSLPTWKLTGLTAESSSNEETGMENDYSGEDPNYAWYHPVRDDIPTRWLQAANLNTIWKHDGYAVIEFSKDAAHTEVVRMLGYNHKYYPSKSTGGFDEEHPFTEAEVEKLKRGTREIRFVPYLGRFNSLKFGVQ